MREKKKLLLHACCAPCATYVVEEMRSSFRVEAHFYNPNIHPEEEYRLRLSEFRRYASLVQLTIVEGAYETDKWFQAVKGYENEPEGGARCTICYSGRIEQAAILARQMDCHFFATTLTVGPGKKAALINEIGESIGKQYGLEFLKVDFKKHNGFKKSCELSKQFNLYRQNYCGCAFSRKQGGASISQG